jgi:tetraacyldisaccharide 4'-kinase
MKYEKLKDSYMQNVWSRKEPRFILFKWVLSISSIIYTILVKLRYFLYNVGILKKTKLLRKVISVGNITVGGTGKTPTCEWLSRIFSGISLKVAILSRGYGKIPQKGIDDEEMPFQGKNITRLVNKNRVLSAKSAIEDFNADIIILDDGFQYHKLAKDLDIVLIDTLDPFSNYHLLPRGFLRESPKALKHADIIILTHANHVTPQELQQIRTQIRKYADTQPILSAIHKPIKLIDLRSGKTYSPAFLRGKRVYGFCGIGNPVSFRKTLESLEAEVVRFRAFADHHIYTQLEIKQIVAEAGEFMAEFIITTEKDVLKLYPEDFKILLFALKIKLEIIDGEDKLLGKLQELLRDRKRPFLKSVNQK